MVKEYETDVSFPRTTIMWLLFFHVADIATDIAMNVDFFQNGDIYYFTASTCFLILPNLMFALLHLVMDPWKKNLEKLFNFLFDLFGLQIFWRAYMMQKNIDDQSGFQKLHKSLANLIRLFEVFFESIPQLILQSYILMVSMKMGGGWLWPTYRNILNVFSLSFGFASIASATTLADREIDMTWEYYVNVFYYFSQVALRCIALAYFQLQYYMYYFWLFVIVDFILMGLFFYFTERFCPKWSTATATIGGRTATDVSKKFLNIFRFFFQTFVCTFVAYHVFFKKVERNLIVMIIIEVLVSALAVYLALLNEFKYYVTILCMFFACCFIISGCIVIFVTYMESNEENWDTTSKPSSKQKTTKTGGRELKSTKATLSEHYGVKQQAISPPSQSYIYNQNQNYQNDPVIDKQYHYEDDIEMDDVDVTIDDAAEILRSMNKP